MQLQKLSKKLLISVGKKDIIKVKKDNISRIIFKDKDNEVDVNMDVETFTHLSSLIRIEKNRYNTKITNAKNR